MSRIIRKHFWPARFRQRLLTAFLVTVSVSVGCVSPETPQPTTLTTVSILGDSEWKVPPGFDVALPFTNERFALIIRNDPGPSPDVPEFTMSGEVEASGGRERLLIVVYSDGVSHETQATDVLASFQEKVVGGTFIDAEVTHQGSLSFATTRGVVQVPEEAKTVGLILTSIVEQDTGRAWRLMCTVESREVSDEIEQICEDTRSQFRPLQPH